MKAFVAEVQRLHPAVPLGVPHANKSDLKVKVSSEGGLVFKPMSFWSLEDLNSCLFGGWRALPRGKYSATCPRTPP